MEGEREGTERRALTHMVLCDGDGFMAETCSERGRAVLKNISMLMGMDEVYFLIVIPY